MPTTTAPVPSPKRPGWLEITVALAIYVTGITLLAIWMMQTSSEQVILRVNMGGAVNGALGLTALLVAYALRVRDWHAFGFRAATRKWLFIGAGLGVVAFGLSFIIEGIYFHFISEPNTQADFQAAAKAGSLSLAMLLFTCAILGPLGEEFVFRGVVASALNKHGAWAGVVGSAAIFGLVHGPSVILLDAFMVGILTGIIFRKTGSIWPAIVLHIIYNALHLMYYATL